MDKNHSLQNLLNNTASEEDIALLKRLLASGEISIGGNVNQSVIIIGSGNTVELPPAALDRLNARPMLGNLDRDLTNEEIAAGLRRLDKLLSNRAPVLLPHYKEQVGRLRPTLKTEIKALSETSRRERVEALAAINSICAEAVDVSFNGLCLGEEAPKYDARSPFRGLESFRPEDSEFFFGREALTKKLVGKINAHSFLAVLGASGSGKSSLVMAGVIPALASDYAIIRPGTNPLDGLESVRGKSLIVVDQFEELFTLTRDESTRKDFIARLLDESARARIILTLRSDFLGDVGAYRTLSAEIQNHLEIVPPMDMDELRRAMEGQAGVVGLRFEADLSQQILDDVAGEPGAMPLLQHALWELWNRRHGHNLRASEYRAFGGVKQAITSTAEKVYADCPKPEQDQVRDIFLRLTRLDEGEEGRDTRRRVPLGDLIPSGRDAASITLLLDKLANARLIVKTVNGDGTEIEVAHEALIRHWERLRIWLNEDRDALHLRESVNEDARRWENEGRDESMLNHRGGRLDDALSLGDNSRYGLTETEQSYLNACAALRNREQRERERRLRYTVITSIAAAVIFLVLAGFGWVKSSEATARANEAATAQVKAEEQANIAIARQLAAQAQYLNSTISSKQMIATLLDIQSMKLFLTDVGSSFLINDNRGAIPFSYLYQGWVNSVAFSPDGKYVVSGGVDHNVHVWEAASGIEIARMSHNWDVTSVAFSPDGKYIVSGSGDKTARVWETISGTEVAHLLHEGWVYSVAFSPDGKYVVSGSDNTVRVWESVSGVEVARMTHREWVTSVAFSPDGKYIVSGSDDSTARVWEVTSGLEVARMTHGDTVKSVAFSPDSKYVVSGSVDDTARVWESVSGLEIIRITHDSWVNAVAFSSDGKYIVSGSEDNTARVWDVVTGNEISRMTHDSWVTSVAFSSDGKYVISGSEDNTARVWDTVTGKEVARMTHDSIVTSVAFGPDKKSVISGSRDNTARVWKTVSGVEITNVKIDNPIDFMATSKYGEYIGGGDNSGIVQLWDTTDGKEVARISHEYDLRFITVSPNDKYIMLGNFGDGVIYVWDIYNKLELSSVKPNGYVTSIEFSPDNNYIVLGSQGGLVEIREIATGFEISHMSHNSTVNTAAFSPDGKYVVSGSMDGTARLWDIETGKEITRISHGSSVTSVAFSPDGKYVVSGSADGTGLIWEAINGLEVVRIKNQSINLDSQIVSVIFSPDGKYVLAGGGDTVRIWDFLSKEQVDLLVHDGWITSVVFSPDGQYIVSGSTDKTARVWRIADGMEIARMKHDSSVYSVMFSPNGKNIVSRDGNGTILIWPWKLEDLITKSCETMPRNLTRAEWTQYIGDALPYQAVCPNLPIEAESTPTP